MLCLTSEWLDSPSESIIFLHSETELIIHNHCASKGKKVDKFFEISPEIMPSNSIVNLIAVCNKQGQPYSGSERKAL